jgi:AbrB family looped-hinge helix DNA binding protein
MPTTTITSKGQVTLPKQVREHLRVTTGDRLDFLIMEDGTVIVCPVKSRLGDLRGALHRPGRPPVSTEEMMAAIEREHGRR